MHALEDPAWPPQRRLWGAEAAQVIARIGGDVGDALRRSRELLALDRARGGDGSIAFGNLIDAELAAGDARAAALSGAEFVQALQGTRHEYSLAYARLNLCAAWLALDEIAQARAVVQAAWPQALVFELEHYATAYLALLAALEGRAQDAARLLGYSAAIYSARVEARETNEAVAMARAEQIARQQLGDAEFGRAVAAGAALGEREIAVVAFADAASIRDSHGLH